MVEQSGSPAPDPTAEPDEYERDLDAWAPRTITFTFEKQSYEVRQFEDLPWPEMQALLRMESELRATKDWTTIMEIAQRQTQMLVPDLPAEVLARMSRRQMVQLGFISLGLKKRPTEAGSSSSSEQKEDNVVPEPVSSSPAPLASTATPQA